MHAPERLCPAFLPFSFASNLMDLLIVYIFVNSCLHANSRACRLLFKQFATEQLFTQDP